MASSVAAGRAGGMLARSTRCRVVSPSGRRGSSRSSSGIGRRASRSASASRSSHPASARSMRSMTRATLDRDARVRAALYRTRLLANRTPHFSRSTRKEANRALDILEGQLGLNQVNAADAARGIELLNRAHSSLAFALMRNDDFVDRFAAAIRRLGLRGITDRLDEVPHSVMALPIPGPIGDRSHRDDLPAQERVHPDGSPLPPLPGYGTLPSAQLFGQAR